MASQIKIIVGDSSVENEVQNYLKEGYGINAFHVYKGRMYFILLKWFE